MRAGLAHVVIQRGGEGGLLSRPWLTRFFLHGVSFALLRACHCCANQHLARPAAPAYQGHACTTVCFWSIFNQRSPRVLVAAQQLGQDSYSVVLLAFIALIGTGMGVKDRQYWL
jgi:hypothetical protein